MLTDEEANEIRQKLDAGWRGPALIAWVRRLLDDRDERRRAEDAGRGRPPSQESARAED